VFWVLREAPLLTERFLVLANWSNLATMLEDLGEGGGLGEGDKRNY